jgi:hypothetical protein
MKGLTLHRRTCEPSRIKYPMVGKGWSPDDPNPEDRGEDEFERVSWEEAIDLLAGKMAGLEDNRQFHVFDAIKADGRFTRHGSGRRLGVPAREYTTSSHADNELRVGDPVGPALEDLLDRETVLHQEKAVAAPLPGRDRLPKDRRVFLVPVDHDTVRFYLLNDPELEAGVVVVLAEVGKEVVALVLDEQLPGRDGCSTAGTRTETACCWAHRNHFVSGRGHRATASTGRATRAFIMWASQPQ